MKRTLRFKVTFSFSLLIILLVAAGFMSHREFESMGKSINSVLKNNYESIKISKTMLDAMINEDKGVVRYVLNSREQGRNLIEKANGDMRAALENARGNITESDEGELIAVIEEGYEKYHDAVLKILNTADGRKIASEYEQVAHDHAIVLQEDINKLISINQDKMYAQSLFLSDSAARALMPILVSIGVSVVFVLVLLYFFRIYLMQPLQRIIEKLKGYYRGGIRIDAKITTDDEFKLLENEINNLVERLKSK